MNKYQPVNSIETLEEAQEAEGSKICNLLPRTSW